MGSLPDMLEVAVSMQVTTTDQTAQVMALVRIYGDNCSLYESDQATWDDKMRSLALIEAAIKRLVEDGDRLAEALKPLRQLAHDEYCDEGDNEDQHNEHCWAARLALAEHAVGATGE